MPDSCWIPYGGLNCAAKVHFVWTFLGLRIFRYQEVGGIQWQLHLMENFMAGAGIRLAIYLLLFKILLSLKYFAKSSLVHEFFFFQPFCGVNVHVLTHAMFVQCGNNIVTNFLSWKFDNFNCHSFWNFTSLKLYFTCTS